MAYCTPTNAGLASEAPAVCKRLGTLLQTLDGFSWAICNGDILDDLKGLRGKIIDGLERDGYFCTYDGGDRMKVYEPGSKTGERKRRERDARLKG